MVCRGFTRASQISCYTFRKTLHEEKYILKIIFNLRNILVACLSTKYHVSTDLPAILPM